jgi:hypothetical protein
VAHFISAGLVFKSKVALFIFVSLCSSLVWSQVAETNAAVRDPLATQAVGRVADQIAGTGVATPSGSRLRTQKGALVVREFKHDTGPLLREIAPLLPEFGVPSEREIENNVNPNHNWSSQVVNDPVLQTGENSPSSQTPTFDLEFEGAGSGDSFFCNCMPPDNDGAVGTTQYVQFINLEYKVFDKSGNTVLGPLAGKSFWSGFGGECEAENNGDPSIRFDAAAGRWVVSQFALGPGYAGPFYECVAVSQTDDATGAFHRYAFPMTYLPDYPKLAVWPDAYYFTFNNFPASGSGYIGADVCAADRTRMLAGSAATMQCFQQNSTHYGMLAADLDGSTPPAAGTSNFVMELDPDGSANLELFKFHVDFTTPANSTFTGPTLIAVSAFTPLCVAQFRTRCVPQPTSGSDTLESLGDRLMWRLVYRNFGDHTTLLTTHSIVAGTSGGVRWYEIRNPETSPTVFQSGTFAPDSQYRFMPAIAMDQNQDLAIGYTVSGAAAGQYPSLAYAGRIPTDAAGTLESEVVLLAGLGSQLSGYDRWGDYSSLTVDPTDDCTFWFTEEYEKSTGGFNWSTAIGSFKFPGCTSSGPPTISNLSPTSGAVGASVTITGTNFGSTKGTSSVTFNGTAATTITSWSATSIAATVPTGATTGNVVVTVGGQASNGSAFTVSVVPTIVWTQPSPITYGATLSGILNASAVDGSTPVPGTFAYTATIQGGSAIAVTDASVLGGGSYTLNAAFTPTDNITYASANGSVALIVNKATPTIALGTSADTVFSKTSVTFTATVSSSVSTPTGSVRFYDGATMLGSAVMLAQGVATYTASTLAVGSHSITAVYGGDSNFSTVTSSAVSETVQDFTLNVASGSSSSQTVSPGGTANYSLQLAPSGGTTFPAQITLTVAGLPAGATATIAPQTVAAGAGTTDVALSILVAAQSSPIQQSSLIVFQLSPLMVGVLLPFSGKIRRAAGKQWRVVRLLLFLFAATSLLGIAGCGGHSSSGPPTYTLTMTATSGSLSHAKTLTLTVQ